MNRPLILLAAALIAGCAVGPDYRPPATAAHRLRRRGAGWRRAATVRGCMVGAVR